ncbi:cystatin-like [Trichomycterus rosablanca]|uniref:cystatin-like n=1 Tax=Trichomycterus rosablanca TaxID=2290929 RepID=UPI002F34F532
MYCKSVVLLFVVVFVTVSSAGLVGGLTDVSIDEPDVQSALKFAVVQHNHKSNDLFMSRVTKIDSVQKQVVSGTKYIFTVEMARTCCRKGGVEELCAVNSDPAIAMPHQCRLAVWTQPWLNMINVVENTCQ